MQASSKILSKKIVFFIVLFALSLLMFSLSCQTKTAETEPENVCNLTPEQIPEIRGFKLGMSIEEVRNKFADFCGINESVKDISNEKITNVSISLDTSPQKERINKLGNGKCLLMGYSDYRTSLSYSLSSTDFPEFEGVDTVKLRFKDSKVSEMKLNYDLTKDEQLVKVFEDKIINAIGLSQWTNWEMERKKPKTYVKSLLCNHVKFSLSAEDISSKYPTPLFQMYFQIEKN